MRQRLILSFIVVVLVAILSVILVVRLDNETQVQTYMFRGGSSGTEALVLSLEQYYQQNQSWTGVEKLFTSLHAATPSGSGMGRRPGGGMGPLGNVRLRLADSDGKLLVDSMGAAAGAVLPVADLNSGIQLKGSAGTLIGYLLVEGSSSYQRGDELPLLSRLNDAAWRAGLIALGIALVLALILATGIIRPIQRLTAAVRQLAAGDLNHRVQVSGRDELAALGQAFNSMADSLRASEEHRRAMTADIAHELRSPLAVQRAHLEALQDGIYPLTTENLQPIVDQAALLERLVEDLRTLALADAGELRLEKVDVNLKDLLEGILERFKPAADSRSITLSLLNGADDLASQCPHLQADPDRLAQVMNNLLTNALRHTPVGGAVQLQLRCQPGYVCVDVQDSGPGIPPDALPHIFERFYRADHARSRDKGGFGLGLAIARQLAVAHGGSLTAANVPEGGAVFTLTLPV